MESVLDTLNQAAQQGDWLVLTIGGVAVVASIVLKALGKSIPVVDSIIGLALKVLPSIRKQPKPEAQPGIESVVDVKDQGNLK